MIPRDEANLRMADCCNNCGNVKGWHIAGLKTCAYYGDVPVTGVCDLHKRREATNES